MACLYQLFKLTVVIINLVSFGMGYAKFYQLFVDIGSSVTDIGNAESFADLVWLPYLAVQVLSTIGLITMVYCLIRELCEDCFMYNHCFKCCFVITVLIYSLCVIPKSILNIVYYNFDLSIQEWWNKLTDILDSLLAGLGTLGFQIILYLKVIRRILRSAGVCKGSDVNPKMDVLESGESASSNKGCCLVVCCCRGKPNDEAHDTTDKKNQAPKQSALHSTKAKAKAVYHKGTRVVKKTNTRVKNIQEKAEKKKQEAMSKISNAVDEKKAKAKNVAIARATLIKENVLKKDNTICIECQNDTLEMSGIKKAKEDSGNYTSNSATRHRLCLNCGKELKEVGDNADDEDNQEPRDGVCCHNAACVRGKGCCVALLNNRMKCFIITMVMAQWHMVIFCVEFVFIVCVVC